MGRHKIEIKKIEDEHSRLISFSKRKKGFFKKADDLAGLGFLIAALVFSPARNVFTYGSPDFDSVVDCFLNSRSIDALADQERAAPALANKPWRMSRRTRGRRDDGSDQEELLRAASDLRKSSRFWWNKSTEDMTLEELVDFKVALQALVSKVKEKAEERQHLNLDISL
ncbi:agamous-like MADS-box protein AGL29 [Typha angustifolia]|uniref:agamous-like MADS-box protein AGL29 n=1 Tax=Typha angustifolia TaxID=59011 RepID=UPI003C2D1952